MLAPALTAIPEEIETAAESLGADWLRTLWHVVLPMARPGLIGAGLVVLTLSLTDFAMPAMLGGGSQDFIANAIYDQFFRTSDQGLGSALTVLLVASGPSSSARSSRSSARARWPSGRGDDKRGPAHHDLGPRLAVARDPVGPDAGRAWRVLHQRQHHRLSPDGFSLQWYEKIALARDLRRPSCAR